MLDGVNVALGVTGSIAAVRTVELAHELRRRGAAVRGVLTEAARGIVHPWAVQFATDRPPVTELTGDVEHVDLCGRDGWADALLVAPATANTVGKMAAGIDDTTVTSCATTALGAECPVVVAPAMHEPMYDHPAVETNLARIEEWGVDVVPPRLEEGKAKIATHDAIATAVARAVPPSPLAGRSVVVTSGATAEPIDAVRVLTSRASGRTGRAVARACAALGADVTLVHPDGAEPWATTRTAATAAEMRSETLRACEDADALVSAAAVGDYTVDPAAGKLPSGEPRTLELEPTPKLVDAVRDAFPDLTIVGFKTEADADRDALVEAARAQNDRVDLAFTVANDASVMGDVETEAYLVPADAGGVERIAGSKAFLGATVAAGLADALDGAV
ncbi:MAG: bifunctional phosphopantothenoylcysteine decarboxylase/phosphopantothenate--cysteine ligase CoaBC [Halobacteriaceae archaeon]